GITHVLTKMGLMGIQLRIATKAELPQEFQLVDGTAPAAPQPAETPAADAVQEAPAEQKEETVNGTN
ncbi:MAG: hypothetical protein QXG20_11350, partial [Nitrososphaera sp.]